MKALAAWLVLRLWIATLRYRRCGPPFDQPGLIAFWHGDQLPLFRARPAGPVVAPVSMSRDGRLQAKILRRLGIRDVPGSSSRGGLAAARGLLRAIRGGAIALLAVDGPRGPRGQVKPGVVYLAQRTGTPIWPVAVAVGRGRRLARAWDRYLLPLPFTRAVVWVGDPLFVPPEADVAQTCDALAAQIEAAGQAAAAALRAGR